MIIYIQSIYIFFYKNQVLVEILRIDRICLYSYILPINTPYIMDYFHTKKF